MNELAGSVADREPLTISIVVPCYNEEEMLPSTILTLSAFLDEQIRDGLAASDSEILFVDDGSDDGTWDLIAAAHAASPTLKGVRLSVNSGHQNALMAGLASAMGDFVISMDADLQDDVSVMRDMILEAVRGVDIVYGVRKNRESDTFFKRFTAESFYRLMSLLGVKLVFNHADFRGMSRRSLEALLRFPERDLFLRGMVNLLGFRTSKVYYVRSKREAGVSKYPFLKMLYFAFSAVTSFSFFPLRIVTLAGLGMFLLSLVLVAWILVVRLLWHQAIPGWASLLAIFTVFGGIQLFCTGIIGEYLSVIFREIKHRPRYIIMEVAGVHPIRTRHTTAVILSSARSESHRFPMDD